MTDADAIAALVAIGGEVLTEEQKEAIASLRRCSMSSGSWDKRFFRGICEIAATAEYVQNHGHKLPKDVPSLLMPKPLTPKQNEQLMRMVHTYRRQGTGCRCEECQSSRLGKRR